MTLLICFYATGTMINLSHDYRSMRLTIPVLMVQPTVYWLLTGLTGLAIAVILVGLTALMISSVRNSQRTFEESIRIRFEKDDLLVQLEREKETAVNALRQAEIANRSKSFFMAAASHDLRQPLYAGTLLCETLALHNLPPEAAELLKQQRKALAAAGGLFDNLLDLTKFESGSVAPTLSSVNLEDVVKEVESEYQALCRARGLTLDIGATAYCVRSDYDLLTRMVRNLVSNAAKYTASGGVRIYCGQEDRDGASDGGRHRHRHRAGGPGTDFRGVRADPVTRKDCASTALAWGLLSCGTSPCCWDTR